MDLKEIHDRIDFEITKEVDGYVSPEQKDIALDAAQLRTFSFLLGNEAEFSPQVPLSRSGYGKHQKIHNYLSPFKVELDYTRDTYTQSNQVGTNPDGIIVLPEDFLYLTGIYSTSKKRIKIVNEDELADHLDSEILRPTSASPIAIFGGKGGVVNGVSIEGRRKIQLFPPSGLAVSIYFLRRPKQPALSYTMSGRKLVYAASSSVQMEWDDIAMEQLIIPRAIELIARNLKDNEQTQYSVNKNTTGI